MGFTMQADLSVSFSLRSLRLLRILVFLFEYLDIAKPLQVLLRSFNHSITMLLCVLIILISETFCVSITMRLLIKNLHLEVVHVYFPNVATGTLTLLSAGTGIPEPWYE